MAPRHLAALNRLRERIDGWRSSRKKLHPMPPRLWREAATLAHELGINPVSGALGLNYESLKRHVRDAGGASSEASPAPIARFVELSGAQVLGVPSTAAAGPVVELCDASGTRLTIRLAGGSTLEVAEVVAAFRRCAP
jgi:hypothetical protein